MPIVDVYARLRPRVPAALRNPGRRRSRRSSQFLFAEGIGYRAEIELFSGLAALCFNTAELARPERFELPTYSSGGCRSIQLSYGRAPSSLHWDARRAQES